MQVKQLVGKNSVVLSNVDYAYDWYGTKEEYDQAVQNGIIQDSWTCYITDDFESTAVIPNTLYTNRANVSQNAIYLMDDTHSYIDIPTSNRNYIFNISNLAIGNNKVITFDLIIKMESTLYSINFTTYNSVSWLTGISPNINSTNTNYLLTFRSYDNGVTWVGNVQGYWK